MHWVICKHPEDKEEGASESSTGSYYSKDEDSAPTSPYIPKCSVEVCYREEKEKFAWRFPNVVIRNISSYNVPNVDSFDVVPSSRASWMTDLEHILQGHRPVSTLLIFGQQPIYSKDFSCVTGYLQDVSMKHQLFI